MTRVAVLGAGFQGTCAALELARRGIDVDLYDKNDTCITQAGLRNEGKVHLGFVFARDPSLDTTRLLVRGALTFDRALRRWLESDLAGLAASTPHNYAVHRDSMMPVDAVLAHFARVRDYVHEFGGANRVTYLGQDPQTVGFERQGLGTIYDPESIAAVIRTDERSVDVNRMAARLRDRVAAEPRITFHSRTNITQTTRESGSIKVSATRDGVAPSARYRHVVNCLWDGKLVIDQQMQFLPAYRSLYRLKFGITAILKTGRCQVPSTTFVVGPFGDVVVFDERRLYLSWYPVARTGLSTSLAPVDGARELTGNDARRMFDATLAAFARLVVPMRDFHADHFEDVVVAGGIIVAAGSSDIDDPNSRLHTRSAVGIRSMDGYHSVDTGKYTLAPMFAVDVADRVCGTA